MPHTVKVSVAERHGRQLVSTGSPWEPKVGYSRAVRAGDFIFITGTVGIEADGSFAPGAGDQARRALTIIRATLQALGGTLLAVVRTRIYLTDINHWEEVGRVHGEAFGDIRPATTLVEVSRLIDPAALVEIEADAILRPDVTSIA